LGKTVISMTHEDLTRDHQVEGSSNRALGLVFAGAFLLIAVRPLFDGETPRWWASVVAAGFGLVALVKPTLLAGLNRLWIEFGVLLGKIVSPIALGVLFFCVLTPIGLMIRLTGKDHLSLKRDPDADSYWIPREPPGPPPDSMTNQY
jgi:hypothetical protein